MSHGLEPGRLLSCSTGSLLPDSIAVDACWERYSKSKHRERCVRQLTMISAPVVHLDAFASTCIDTNITPH